MSEVDELRAEIERLEADRNRWRIAAEIASDCQMKALADLAAVTAGGKR